MAMRAVAEAVVVATAVVAAVVVAAATLTLTPIRHLPTPARFPLRSRESSRPFPK